MVRCGDKPDKLVDLYFDEVDDVEVDEPWHALALQSFLIILQSCTAAVARI